MTEQLPAREQVAVYLHGGPLDTAIKDAPLGPDGTPAEMVDVEYGSGGGRWYVQYRRVHEDGHGWHYEATGNEERADEE